jgi:hypothetical protein
LTAVASAQLVTVDPPPRPISKDIPIDVLFYELDQLDRTGDLTFDELRAEVDRRSINFTEDGRVHAELVGPKSAEPLPESVITTVGGRIEHHFGNQFEVWIPIDELMNLALSLPEGFFLKRMTRCEYEDTGGEGTIALNSDSYLAGGADGSGMTVAIIDAGFIGLTVARDSGDAPPPGVTTEINLTESGFEATEKHGTGCVEAAYDHCPGATWMLFKTDSPYDEQTAVLYAIAGEVDVLSFSKTWFTQSWGDNWGVVAQAINNAAAAGILCFVSAGNYAQSHYEGNYNEGGGSDYWHDFGPDDETITVVVGAGGSVSVNLVWDTTGGVYSCDLDLFLYDHTMSNVIASSEQPQYFPEFCSWTNNTGSAQTIHITVYRDSGEIDNHLEVFAKGGTWQEHIVSSSSTWTPSNATNPNVICVGAVTVDSFAVPPGVTPPIKGYSSRGPTNQGTMRPDMTGPTDTRSVAYGGPMGGTSNATPNLAGAACCLWSADPLLHPNAIRWLLHKKAYLWRDWGDPGMDNIYGRGGGILYDFAPNTLWIARDYGNTSNNRAAPFYTVQAAHDWATFDGRLLLFEGGDYPEEPLIMDTPLHIKTIEYDAYLGTD